MAFTTSCNASQLFVGSAMDRRLCHRDLCGMLLGRLEGAIYLRFAVATAAFALSGRLLEGRVELVSGWSTFTSWPVGEHLHHRSGLRRVR